MADVKDTPKPFVKKGYEFFKEKDCSQEYERDGEGGPMVATWKGEEARSYRKVAEEYFAHVEQVCDEGLEDWTALGTKDGIQFERSKSRTEGGNGYFRLKARLAVRPELLMACIATPDCIGALDETTVYQKVVEKVNAHTDIVHTVAAPGPIFAYRDFLDLASWRKDENGVLWQMAVSIPSAGLYPHYGCIRGYVMYWGYKFSPVSVNGEIHTDVVCVSQSDIRGWMPPALTNNFVGPVLADYVHKLEVVALDIIAKGQDEDLVKSAGII
uniref:START domain-containing protein n=1 Tax=Paramoeba aestuarina TaxID=180227 RepID=A0A7S4KF25_9EUKA|mmetsp:Transcript_18136/g.28403  ORF Transcript_18136/g.28403 Transcript_18136/m.28403 type:complete len:270 (+) Transcript_18136:103-912(+)|eukprot:CAMPEP_0201519812 /NCGR_PEP_ID=MMETSP0161_2-20130828/10269_1 /ASSEMBLY_ACC=CAM_ASM_000251 /TAXON_ID=180227 /ORGANISM="Neoparamoeba aestuarina, Strain SoJaBio B1-5/56/2" /LENGTH=269 /DNA_ID=CAMNT_0047917965 /DNA_START=113 /DNA_END=922 /DNA_ORIENTATION=-